MGTMLSLRHSIFLRSAQSEHYIWALFYFRSKSEHPYLSTFWEIDGTEHLDLSTFVKLGLIWAHPDLSTIIKIVLILAVWSEHYFDIGLNLSDVIFVAKIKIVCENHFRRYYLVFLTGKKNHANFLQFFTCCIIDYG